MLERPAPPTSDQCRVTMARSVLAGTIRLVDRFSTMAGISIALVLVAGTALAIAEVGSVANLFETGYGQTLLVKIALVGLLIIVAAYNRFLLVPWLSVGGGSPGRSESLAAGWRRLLATIRLEALIAVAILAASPPSWPTGCRPTAPRRRRLCPSPAPCPSTAAT